MDPITQFRLHSIQQNGVAGGETPTIRQRSPCHAIIVFQRLETLNPRSLIRPGRLLLTPFTKMWPEKVRPEKVKAGKGVRNRFPRLFSLSQPQILRLPANIPADVRRL